MGTVTPIGGHPGGCKPGERCDWEFLDDDSGKSTQVRAGLLLGYATSWRREHNHPLHDPLATGRSRHPSNQNGTSAPCSACRWFEIHIVREATGPGNEPTAGNFVVSYVGRTVRPGETDRSTCHVTPSAHTVIEVLTQTRNGTMFIPRTSRLALSEAAGLDTDIESAWIDRAIS